MKAQMERLNQAQIKSKITNVALSAWGKIPHIELA